MNPYKKCLRYGVDQTTFSSCKNLSKSRELQIFKFKQGNLSDDYNNDEKNKATKRYKNVQNMFSDKTWLTNRGMKGQLPRFFDGRVGGGGGYKKPERAVYNK